MFHPSKNKNVKEKKKKLQYVKLVCFKEKLSLKKSKLEYYDNFEKKIPHL